VRGEMLQLYKYFRPGFVEEIAGNRTSFEIMFSIVFSNTR
jgi:hypothetical protein